MFYDNLANRIPHPAKSSLKKIIGFLPTKYRYGNVFINTLNFLDESQWWSKEQLEEYQFNELKKLLNHSYEHVPYYKNIFNDLGINIYSIRDLDDFKQIPCLEKDTFKSNFDLLTSNNVNLNSFKISKINTSGSTGKPLTFYNDNKIQQKELAFIFHQWSRVNYELDDRRAMLRGSITTKKSYQYDPFIKVLHLSPNINTKIAKNYIKKIKTHKINFIHGYPSVIVYFSQLIKKANINIPFKLKAVLFASEPVYKWQREIVEDIFKCRTFSIYGMAEKVCLAGECENSSNYHFMPQYGITEIDKKTGEIIATGFLNYINPFIRYKTGDIAKNIISNSKCCDRDYFPIVSGIEGRTGDYIITNKGLISPTGILSMPLKKMESIKKTQIIQKSEDLIIVKVVPWEKTPKYYQDLKELEKRFKEILGLETNILIEETDDIKSDKSGKYKWIISEISDKILKENF